jgi:hypothetical protein
MRVKKNARTRRQMCSRLTVLIDQIYGNDAEVARIMGYANSSPLYRVRAMDAFPDVERLERLVNSPPAPGVVVNLNWLVAGKGAPLLKVARGAVADELSLGTFIDKYRASKA